MNILSSLTSSIGIQIIYIVAIVLMFCCDERVFVHCGSCGPKFPPNKCQCGESPYEGIKQYVVNCTNVGLRNTSILEFMPQQTQILIFNGNNIPELPWNIFGTINDYKSLTVIDMTNNHIRDIRGKTYHHVSNVKRLILNHNNLSISRDDDSVNHHHSRVFSNFLNLESLHLTNAFDDNTSPSLSEDLHDIFINSNLTKLQKLHLEQNEIKNFTDHKVFCNLPSLRDLYLGDNNLKEINFNLKCLKNLKFLDLERNKFEFVKKNDLQLLNDLNSLPDSERTTSLVIDFGMNPFKCDCKIYEFYEWLKTTSVIVRNKDNLQCSRSEIYHEFIVNGDYDRCNDINISNINVGRLDGSNSNSNINRSDSDNTSILMFLLVFLSFILVILIIALIYVSRDKIKHIVTPVIDNVSKKVQYTSIKDEECPEVHV